MAGTEKHALDGRIVTNFERRSLDLVQRFAKHDTARRAHQEMSVRSFQDDFNDTLQRLVDDGTIKRFESDLGGLGSVLNILVTVTVADSVSPVGAALVRDRVRQAVVHLSDNVIVSIRRAG